MRAAIRQATISEVMSIVTTLDPTEHDLNAWRVGLMSATEVWVGTYDDQLACVLGLIPPTMLSDHAYLWMFHTDVVKGHEFIFVRYSQRMVEKFLERYSIIVGHTDPKEERSVRWLKWLGAEYGEPNGDWMPFVIRRK